LQCMSPLMAAGAIAVGQPADVAKRGISMGFSTNRDTMDEAKARSMVLCKNSGPLMSSILCQVVAHSMSVIGGKSDMMRTLLDVRL